MESSKTRPRSFEIHMVTAADSPAFSLLRWALHRTPVVGLDAEWKPSRKNHHQYGERDGGGGGATSAPGHMPSFPSVSLLQIACRVRREPSDPAVGESPVFLVDLLSVPLPALYELLKEMFVDPSVLKLGFKFKQDLVYLSSTFSSQGCHPGFDRVLTLSLSLCFSYFFEVLYEF
uniref:Uncharacterized protein LOC105037651 n=1 Tax=Elaeis guineensis var. tenera TaxID=51953 RepID=A0A6I9QPY8_ELAGV|nr:uncharacterized protein LOC105037651 [Elaeis guineensis]